MTETWEGIPELNGFVDGVRRYAIRTGLTADSDLPPPRP